jgi:hypothetical protein
MTSERKAASNRKNSQKSTGPRSELGRHHSRHNALRHGLAVAIGAVPSFSKDIETLAATLVNGGGAKTVGEFAREAAEAELDLLRIRRQRASSFETIRGNPEATLEDYAELNESLAKLERYERRAFSRRKRALFAMIEK